MKFAIDLGPHLGRLRLALLLTLVLLAGCGPRPQPEKTIRLEPLPKGPDAQEEFSETESGVRYRILRKGNGVKPGPKDDIEVHYRGRLEGGKVFDSSYGKRPARFTVNETVTGFAEGLQLVSEGGMIELEIPGHLGYGPVGNPQAGIPPNATLYFLVEMEKVFPLVMDQ